MANMIQDETPNSIYNVLLYYVKHTRNQATTEQRKENSVPLGASS